MQQPHALLECTERYFGVSLIKVQRPREKEIRRKRDYLPPCEVDAKIAYFDPFGCSWEMKQRVRSTTCLRLSLRRQCDYVEKTALSFAYAPEHKN